MGSELYEALMECHTRYRGRFALPRVKPAAERKADTDRRARLRRMHHLVPDEAEMTNDLVTWLRAQLDEDERVAGSATSGPWTNDDPLARDGVYSPAIDGFVVDCEYVYMGPFTVHNATHIARHDPNRVLAEVEAKRRILDLHPHQRFAEPPWLGEPRPALVEDPRYVGCSTCNNRTSPFDATHQEVHPGWWCETVRLLALPYAANPGYDESWRP